jgi:hypothetical protein
MASTWYKDFMAAAGVEVGSYKPSPTRYTGPPMDLANMRHNGVRSLLANCLDCNHDAAVNVDHLPGHLAVPSFVRRMVCSKCGSKRVDVRPAWGTKATAIPS